MRNTRRYKVEDILVESWCSMCYRIVGHKKRGKIPHIEQVAGAGVETGAYQVLEAYLGVVVGVDQLVPLARQDQQVLEALGVLVLQLVLDHFLKYKFNNVLSSSGKPIVIKFTLNTQNFPNIPPEYIIYELLQIFIFSVSLY